MDSAGIAPTSMSHAHSAEQHVDVLISTLASAQHGVVARRQLTILGVTRQQVEHRIATHRLLRQYRGVYAVGHESLTPEGNRMAAVLACGPGAMLSHRSAAVHHDIVSMSRSRIEVTVPRGGPRRVRGVQIHVSDVAVRDRVVVDGIPVTSVARTIVDLATVTPRDVVASAIEQAIRLDLYDHRALEAQMRPGRAGTTVVREILRTRHPEAHVTRSTFEELALPLMDGRRFPRPEVNTWMVGPDCDTDLRWPGRRLVVQLDGWATHRTRAAFERDRYVSVELQARGWTVLRFTWKQVFNDQRWVIGHIERAWTAGGA